MKWTLEKVRKALNGRLIGNPFVKEMICKTILLLPPDSVVFVCSKIWFISSPEDAWAFTFRGSEIKEKSLIILSDELFQQNKSQIRYTILHEIGHVVLNHRNAIGYEQTQSEIDQQENEADQFAKSILAPQR
jgi:hypothetical protein